MCGIAGIFAYRKTAPPVDSPELLAIRDAMALRGPDGKGSWRSPDGRIGLAHRRLAIIDLTDTGAQPMASVDGQLQITFNGEIYNYQALRAELVAKGYRFQSTSDTEVLLNLYLDRGAAMVEALRGMYAFAIWDARKHSLFLARDPFGIKPLYIADDGTTFRFASQVKALLKGGHVDDAPSPAGYVGFYLWGHVPDPHTLFRNIAALPAGTTMYVDAAGPHSPRQFFNITEEFARAVDAKLTEHEADDLVHAALRDSVKHHMIADVPVGVFLSSGIDSTTLSSLAAEVEGSKLHTITLGFEEYRDTSNDEVPLAEVVARFLNTTHETAWVSRSDFERELPKLLEAMDQPSIDGVNTYFVSRAAASSGLKVALSGVGGDELFGGYPSFRDVPLIAHMPGRFRNLGKMFRRVSAPVLRHFTSPKFAGILEYGGAFDGAYLLRRGLYMPWELPHLLDPELVREGWRALETQVRLRDTTEGIRWDTQKVSALELSWYMRSQLLRDSDWAGMAHSLEIRVPFVDVQMLRTVAPLMADKPVTKTRMARAPNRPLPAEVLAKRKTGFSIPVRQWLQHVDVTVSAQRGLRPWASRLLPQPDAGVRILALVSDAFGGFGGIAKFNRDLLGALCAYAGSNEVVALPRLMPAEPEVLPAKLRYVTTALNNKFVYVLTAIRLALSRTKYDVVFCCHIHLLPIAWIASLLSGSRLVLVVYGIDAWLPTRSRLINGLAGRVDDFISISRVTAERFLNWSGIDRVKGYLLPCSVDLTLFRPEAKRQDLIDKYNLRGKKVIMTVGRLVSAERYKGFDEVLDVLPQLIGDVPNLVYMIVGDGNDRGRLERKVADSGLADRVIFTGLIKEEDKRAYYNLSDAFVMPSKGEGFGIVFLEAMACGVPVIGSKVDGSREALRDGQLGTLVDPSDPSAIRSATLAALRRSKTVPPPGLEHFSIQNFDDRVGRIMRSLSSHPIFRGSESATHSVLIR